MKLILNGGGDGTSVKDARKLLNNIIDHNKKILYIPFAWPDSTYEGCLEFMTDELSDVDKLGIDMVKTPEELFNKNFNDYACLYIGGGNTYKLLNDLKISGNFEKIKKYLIEDDGIVYGGSAGAIIFGKDLDSCKTDDENEVGLKDNTGFNMINGYSLLCHYTSREPEKTELSRNYLLNLSKQKPIYAIPEEDTIYINNEKIEFYGSRPYFEFNNGNEIKKDVYTCKVASLEEIIKKHDYEIENATNDKNNWIIWKEKAIEKYKNNLSITYMGILNDKIICECSAAINPSIVQNFDGLVNDKTAYLYAFRTIEEYQGKGYFSKLFKYMISDLKNKGYEKVTLGVEPDEEKNKEIYAKYGFINHIKDAKEVYPDGTTIDVEYYSKSIK